MGRRAATGSELDRCCSFSRIQAGAGLVAVASWLSTSSSLMSSSLGRMDAKASGLEKEGAVSNDILLEELRLSALSAAEGGLRERPGGGGLVNDGAVGGEVLA